MSITVREYTPADLPAMTDIWNTVVIDGEAFPQTEPLAPSEAEAFFRSQSYCGTAIDDRKVVGLYILHPNNVGRCGHIANASYAVLRGMRGGGIGRLLVKDSLRQARCLGFRIMQFNAVVASNRSARSLYESLGFVKLGTVPGGFLLKNGYFEDIILYYHTLSDEVGTE